MTGIVAYSHEWSATLEDASANTWAIFSITSRADNTSTCYGASTKSLTGMLDRVSITATNGTDTFDAGAINIAYE